MKTQVDHFSVEVAYQDEHSPVMLVITSSEPFERVVIDDTFDNTLIASAFLESSVGYQAAVKALDQLCVSPNSSLWDLNHSRPHPRMNSILRNECFIDETVRPDESYNQIDEINFSDYSSGGAIYLYEREGLLYMAGTFSPGCGNSDHDDALEAVSMSQWLELRKDYDGYGD